MDVMKKTLLILLPALLILASCRRTDYYPGDPDDLSYWLSKERGMVNYSDGYCNYIAIETYGGFSVLRVTSGYLPYQGDVVHGDLSRYGLRSFYNRTGNDFFQADVRDYWLTYYDAISEINWLCGKP